MQKIIFVFLLLVFSIFPYAQAEIINKVIMNYRAENYMQAVELLERIENKNAKIYYYLGLSYFKAGYKDKARKCFLTAYYLSPESKWGKAGYKNFAHLNKKIFHFNAFANLSYDSNVSYSPDIEQAGYSSALLNVNLSGKLNFARFASANYSYLRNFYLSDIENNDTHSLSMDLFKDKAEFSVGSSYSTMGGSPFYYTWEGNIRFGIFSAGIKRKEYINQSYDYLDGYEISGSLYGRVSQVGLGCEFEYNQAEDLNKDFIYWKHTGTVDDEEYDFEKVESSEEYFLSNSYYSGKIFLNRRFIADEKTTFNISASYMIKDFMDKNYWYRDYWIYDSSLNEWYFWSDKQEKWIESDEPAPGEKQSIMRKDNRIKARVSMNYNLDKNTMLNIFYEYSVNSSSMDDVASYNYNWSKGVLGVGVNYGF
ncbi:MAG: hypothetical protein ACOC5R_03845 [Elusimicrobiota bacterium]